METEYKTVKDVRKLVGVTNAMLNLYNETLNRGFVHPIYLVNASVWDLRDYQAVQPHFETTLLELKEQIKAFRDEFYATKTIEMIAQTSGLPLKVVIGYLQERLPTFKSSASKISEDGKTMHIKSYPFIKNLGENETVLANTEFNNLSSFKILAEIQKEYLIERILFSI